MNFKEFLDQFKDHDQFVAANLDENSNGDYSDDGEYYLEGMPEYGLDIQFTCGTAIISMRFEGDNLDDILDQATDHVNLILAVSSVHGR